MTTIAHTPEIDVAALTCDIQQGLFLSRFDLDPEYIDQRDSCQAYDQYAGLLAAHGLGGLAAHMLTWHAGTSDECTHSFPGDDGCPEAHVHALVQARANQAREISEAALDLFAQTLVYGEERLAILDCTSIDDLAAVVVGAGFYDEATILILAHTKHQQYGCTHAGHDTWSSAFDYAHNLVPVHTPANPAPPMHPDLTGATPVGMNVADLRTLIAPADPDRGNDAPTLVLYDASNAIAVFLDGDPHVARRVIDDAAQAALLLG